jgi:hypothetical protein
VMRGLLIAPTKERSIRDLDAIRKRDLCSGQDANRHVGMFGRAETSRARADPIFLPDRFSFFQTRPAPLEPPRSRPYVALCAMSFATCSVARPVPCSICSRQRNPFVTTAMSARTAGRAQPTPVAVRKRAHRFKGNCVSFGLALTQR